MTILIKLAVAVADGGDEDLKIGEEEVEEYMRYKLRMRTWPEEVQPMELQEVDWSDVAPDYQGPGRRGPGGVG